MKPMFELIDRGGPVMIAIITLSVLLYSRCCRLLLTQLRALSRGHGEPGEQADAQAAFRHQRVMLGAMIAAAPLLGLLGTVSGMVKTFEGLASRSAEKSMEGLAGGISEVLVATESGLLVALPALLLVYLAHRAMQRRQEQTHPRAAAAPKAPAP